VRGAAKMIDDFTFRGYSRESGNVGTRNYLAIIPTVFCVNEVVAALARLVPGARPLLHHHGCCQLQPDLDQTARVLCGLIENPNVGGCVIVSLGCEGVRADDLVAAASAASKPVIEVRVQQEGGIANCIDKHVEDISRLEDGIEGLERQESSLSKLVVGIKCGSSDASSGLAANPAVGVAADLVIEAGGAVVFGETTELIGAEHILADRCSTPETRESLLEMVDRMEDRVRRAGVDMRGSQPTPGNIAGGLTTIEEKSLGAISKCGSKPIGGVLEYAQPLCGKGLFFMDSPGKEDEIMTGLGASGANLIVFSTGGGAPQGMPVVPVIKVASNPHKCAMMRDHIDIDASGIVSGRDSVEAVGSRVFERIMEVASGEKTRAEGLGYDETIGIYVHGPTV
jgi:altronate dehydratase large subunit